MIALFSGLLIAASAPNEILPSGSAISAIPGLVLLYIAFSRARSVRDRRRVGMLFGAVFSAATYYWLAFFQGFSLWTFGGVVVGHVLYFLLWGPLFGRVLETKKNWRPVIFAAAWTAYELFRGTGYLAFPWGMPGQALHPFTALIQVADSFGIHGLNFLCALLAAVVGEWFLEREETADGRPTFSFRSSWLRNAAFAASLLAVFVSYGVFRLSTPVPERTTMRALLVQPNIDSWSFGQYRENLAASVRATKQGISGNPGAYDLVVWPENAIQGYAYDPSNGFFSRNPPEEPFLPFMRKTDAPFLFGSALVTSYEPLVAQNGAVLVNSRGAILDDYGKQHPVPFAEHNPFFEIPGIKQLFVNVIGLSAFWEPGDRWTIFHLPRRPGKAPIRFAVPICFEDTMAYITRHFARDGADLFITITNDSWSGTTAGEVQHYVASIFRTIETRRPLLRSSIAGVTAAIDPYGRELESLPLFQEGSLSVDVSIPVQTRTFYMIMGDWFAYLCAAIVVGALFLRARGTRRPRRTEAGRWWRS